MEMIPEIVTFDQYVFAMLSVVVSSFCIGGVVGFALGRGLKRTEGG